MGPFTWDVSTGRYRDALGRFVSRAAVRDAIDTAIRNIQRRMLERAEQLRDGAITLEAWRREMATDMKDLHLYSGAAARGGWEQMTPADFGRVGRILRDQYAYLNNFARQIASGEQRLDGRFLTRVKMYAEAGRMTFHAQDDALQALRGMTEERNVLHPAEHCEGCLGETAREWVPLGELIPIGQRQCLTFDKCTKEFR